MLNLEPSIWCAQQQKCLNCYADTRSYHLLQTFLLIIYYSLFPLSFSPILSLSLTLEFYFYHLLQPFSFILQSKPILILNLRIFPLSFTIDLSFLFFTLNLSMPFTLDLCLYPLLYQSFPYPSLQSFPIPFTLVFSPYPLHQSFTVLSILLKLNFYLTFTINPKG